MNSPITNLTHATGPQFEFPVGRSRHNSTTRLPGNPAVAKPAAIAYQTTEWTPGEFSDITPSAEWPRLSAHRSAWLKALGKGLHHTTYLVEAESAGKPVGLLPLCLVEGPIFGKFLVSLPYINTGGAWAADLAVATGLISAACDLADQLDVKYLELRHEKPVEHNRLNFERTDKVHMRLSLPDTSGLLLASLKSKVRSQVKKAHQSGLTLEFGSVERLQDFYKVFAITMRDLGTPVFSCALFREILCSFGENAEVCVVRLKKQPVAAAILIHDSTVTEVPSASCLRAFNSLNANMLMYWHLLDRAICRGSEVFDFGRSSLGSGTYKFKAQWGAEPHPATWQYYVRKGDPAEMRADAGSRQRLVRIWKRLPVWVTRLAGPTIVRGIP